MTIKSSESTQKLIDSVHRASEAPGQEALSSVLLGFAIAGIALLICIEVLFQVLLILIELTFVSEHLRQEKKGERLEINNGRRNESVWTRCGRKMIRGMYHLVHGANSAVSNECGW